MTEPRDTEELWNRLEDLAFAFRRAAERVPGEEDDPREELEEMQAILSALYSSEEFRQAVRAAHRKLFGTEGRGSKRTRGFEENKLLEAYRLASGRHAEPDPAKVAHHLLLTVAQLPKVYSRAPGAQPLYKSDQAAHDAAVQRVAEAIKPKLVNPDERTPERVIRAAMRALGADPHFVRNLYRD